MEKKLFKDLLIILRMVYKDDDRMDQETLFDLQEQMAIILSRHATGNQAGELVKEFSHIFKMEYK